VRRGRGRRAHEAGKAVTRVRSGRRGQHQALGPGCVFVFVFVCGCAPGLACSRSSARPGKSKRAMLASSSDSCTATPSTGSRGAARGRARRGPRTSQEARHKKLLATPCDTQPNAVSFGTAVLAAAGAAGLQHMHFAVRQIQPRSPSISGWHGPHTREQQLQRARPHGRLLLVRHAAPLAAAQRLAPRGAHAVLGHDGREQPELLGKGGRGRAVTPEKKLRCSGGQDDDVGREEGGGRGPAGREVWESGGGVPAAGTQLCVAPGLWAGGLRRRGCMVGG
jgi:hypothetical protein